MIVLGWSFADAGSVRPLTMVRRGGLGLVCAPADLAGDPRSRAAIQVRIANDLPAFLPVAPAQDVPIDAGLALTQKRQPEICERLQALTGKAQVSVQMTWPDALEPSRTSSGRDWLLHRKAALEATRKRIDGLAGAVRNILCSTLEMREADARSGQASRLDLLLPKEDCAMAMQRIRERIGGFALDVRGALTLTGPWPAYAFSCLDGTNE